MIIYERRYKMEKYEAPKVEVIVLDTQDILTMSGELGENMTPIG